MAFYRLSLGYGILQIAILLIVNITVLWLLIPFPGKSYWRGRLSTVGLLVLTSLDEFLFVLKISFTFLAKQAGLMRRSTVLSLPPQLVFPGLSIPECPSVFSTPSSPSVSGTVQTKKWCSGLVYTPVSTFFISGCFHSGKKRGLLRKLRWARESIWMGGDALYLHFLELE